MQVGPVASSFALFSVVGPACPPDNLPSALSFRDVPPEMGINHTAGPLTVDVKACSQWKFSARFLQPITYAFPIALPPFPEPQSLYRERGDAPLLLGWPPACLPPTFYRWQYLVLCLSRTPSALIQNLAGQAAVYAN